MHEGNAYPFTAIWVLWLQPASMIPEVTGAQGFEESCIYCQQSKVSLAAVVVLEAFIYWSQAPRFKFYR